MEFPLTKIIATKALLIRTNVKGMMGDYCSIAIIIMVKLIEVPIIIITITGIMVVIMKMTVMMIKN